MSLSSIPLLTQEIQDLYTKDPIPWVIGFSGGKDSTAVLQLVWLAILQLPPRQRTKLIHVITTDTLVESPIVAAWVKTRHEHMHVAAARQAMPIRPHMLYPEIRNTFWVNLIGRGYPAPRHKFRWCTERMKILPSNRFIREVVQQSGEALLVLGSRKAESSRRSATLTRHEEGRVRDRLSPNSKLPNSIVYTPIEAWSNDEVWMYLMQVANPWSGANRDLLTLYRGASADNECPLVVDTSTPSCGNSRFGCWVCTLVERDHSMEAMIANDEDKEWMQPLLDLRNELDEPDDRDRRDYRRMNGRVQLFNDEPIHGPYTRHWREHWLRRVLRAQREVRRHAPPEAGLIELIRLEELHEIRRIWRTEKHEFDDTLPRIYEEEVGIPLALAPESRGDLAGEEWAILREACAGDESLLGLSAKLLSIERQYQSMARRIGVHKALEEQLDTMGYEDRDQAIEVARSRQAIREAEPDRQIELLRLKTGVGA